MKLPETCPFCGAGVFANFCGQNGWKETWVAYECHTWVFADHDRANNQSNLCIARERARLAARVAELERDLEQAKADRARAAMDARNPLLARVAELEARCRRLEEVGDILGAAADAADDDIGQHLQVANYNLHGLLNTGDRVNPPNPPQTIHQNGIDQSVMVRKKVRQALQAWKQAKEAKP